MQPLQTLLIAPQMEDLLRVELSRHLELLQLPSGASCFQQGQRAELLYLLQTGRISIARHHPGTTPRGAHPDIATHNGMG